MDGVTLLRQAREAGLAVQAEGEKLVIRGPKRAEPVARLLIEHKSDVLAVLVGADRTPMPVKIKRQNAAEAQAWRDRYAARIEHWFRGRHPWQEAERLAFGELILTWHREHGVRPDPARCAGCGGELPNGADLILDCNGTRVHIDGVHGGDCIIAYGTRWRGAAVAGLQTLGLYPPASFELAGCEPTLAPAAGELPALRARPAAMHAELADRLIEAIRPMVEAEPTAATPSIANGEEHAAIKLPAKYDAARRALSAAVAIDEVKDILDKSIAMKVYAHQAKDAELLAWSAELRERSTRRLGEVMEDERAAGNLATGTKGQLAGRDVSGGVLTTPPETSMPTLADQGVDKNLAKRARQAAAMPADKFEARIAKTVAIAVAAVEGSKEIIAAAKADSHREKKEKRQAKERQLADKIAALPKAKFGVILADPEWKFEFWSEKGQTNSSAENHYPTSVLDEIKARDVPSICADDCILFLWATVPMQPQALEVMGAWGFRYVSQFAWVKDRLGTGYWNRNQHELLLDRNAGEGASAGARDAVGFGGRGSGKEAFREACRVL